MQRSRWSSSLVAALVFLFCFIAGTSANTIITVENKCPYSICPGVFSDHDSIGALENTGIALAPDASFPLTAPYLWKGRILATTVCSFKPSTSNFSCAEGNCDSVDSACNGPYGPSIPASHVRFSIGSSAPNATDYYAISLADGYNLPVKVVLQGHDGRDSSHCESIECAAVINDRFPADLRVTLPDVLNAPALVMPPALPPRNFFSETLSVEIQSSSTLMSGAEIQSFWTLMSGAEIQSFWTLIFIGVLAMLSVVAIYI